MGNSFAHLEQPSLKEIEKIALEKAPELEHLQNRQTELKETAIALGQLPDPKLQAGWINLPTDTFSTTQENMTQVKFGIVQDFPRGRSLSIKSEQHQLLAMSEGHQLQATGAEILRAVRMNWLELYYLFSARKILQNSKTVFAHLVKVSTSILSVGKGYQYDVLRAQLDVTETETQLIQVEEDIAKVTAKLVRLVGPDIANSIHPIQLPDWSEPHDESTLHEKVKHHPIIKKVDSLIEASRKEIELSEAHYSPAWSLGLHYSFRHGRAPPHARKRADFVGVQLTTELPFFTKNRQDRKLAASTARHKASKSQRRIDLLTLAREVSEYYAMWTQLKVQENLYKNRLMPEAKQYAAATLTAYENRQIDFPTVARAHAKELAVRLQASRVTTNRYKARVYLLYLETEKL